jgi:large subunit ribosomal protein L23
MRLEDVLVRPLITEKATFATEKFNRYGFEVELKANKNQIKVAVESLYDVRVVNVKTSITAGRTKRSAKGGSKKLQKTKKAYIQLGDGQKIEFFKNV